MEHPVFLTEQIDCNLSIQSKNCSFEKEYNSFYSIETVYKNYVHLKQILSINHSVILPNLYMFAEIHYKI